MPIELKMPALSPTMEEGTLAKWLVQEGDRVVSGDLLAEIETDKATMEFEAVDEGKISKIVVAEGTDGVKVGTVIALIQGEDDAAGPEGAASAAKKDEVIVSERTVSPLPEPDLAQVIGPIAADDDRFNSSVLARLLASAKGIDLSSIRGSGPQGRVVKTDLDREALADARAAPSPRTTPVIATDIAQEAVKLSNMRKTIARRLTESKQQIPHIYLTVDIRLDALLKLRAELNAALAPREVRLTVNDMLIKALAVALIEVPSCNASFAGDVLVRYGRADIAVAVAIPDGLITPIVVDAAGKSMATIAIEMKALAERARTGKLQPNEYQGGTASLSNLGMYGITRFDAVINPPQAMIMAVGAGEQRAWIIDGEPSAATIMSATGSFDHRAVDGAEAAQLMQAFKYLVEKPLEILV